MAPEKKSDKTPSRDLSSAVTVPGNMQIAQVFAVGVSVAPVSVRVNVKDSGAGTPGLRISIHKVVNRAVSEEELGNVTLSTSSLTLTDDVKFDSSVALDANTPYAIVVAYPTGQSGDTFAWTAKAGAVETRPCFTGDGSTWPSKLQAVCDFSVFVNTADSSGDSKGPVVSSVSE